MPAMKLLTAKTARFSAMVKSSGRPQLAVLWADPRKDPRFKKAIEQNRIMTIRQENVGTKKDFGFVGYKKQRNVAYLIFPKKLDQYEDRRIVGIDYDLIDNPPLKDPVKVTEVKRAFRGDPSKEKPDRSAGSKLRKFEVIVRVAATMEVSKAVQARSRLEARRKAVEAISDQRFDFSKAKPAFLVVRIEDARD